LLVSEGQHSKEKVNRHIHYNILHQRSALILTCSSRLSSFFLLLLLLPLPV
jgi:hypothetical protein